MLGSGAAACAGASVRKQGGGSCGHRGQRRGGISSSTHRYLSNLGTAACPDLTVTGNRRHQLPTIVQDAAVTVPVDRPMHADTTTATPRVWSRRGTPADQQVVRVQVVPIQPLTGRASGPVPAASRPSPRDRRSRSGVWPGSAVPSRRLRHRLRSVMPRIETDRVSCRTFQRAFHRGVGLISLTSSSPPGRELLGRRGQQRALLGGGQQIQHVDDRDRIPRAGRHRAGRSPTRTTGRTPASPSATCLAWAILSASMSTPTTSRAGSASAR